MNDKLQLLMVSVMSEAFSLFSDKAAELLDTCDPNQFESDPQGTALNIMEEAFSQFRTEFSEKKDLVKQITTDVETKLVDELEAFVDTEYGEYFKKKGNDDEYH